MTKVELEVHDDLISTLNKIKNINDSGVDLVIPSGSILFDNVLSLKTIKARCEKYGVNVTFTTNDERGMALISSADESYSKTEEGLSTIGQGTPPQPAVSQIKPKFKFPALKLPKLKFSFPKNKRIKVLLIPALIVLALVGIYIFLTKIPKAYGYVTVAQQPLTRSLTVKIKKDTNTDANTKVLRGTTVQAVMDDAAEIATTGEKTVGEKASGDITIYNKQDTDITFKKGTKVYKDGLYFATKEEVTVPKRTEQTPDPENPMVQTYTLGEASVEVEATEIGESHNLKEDIELKIEQTKSSVATAMTKSDFTGGESKKVQAVALADIDNITKEINEAVLIKVTSALESKIASTQKLVKGSVRTITIKQTFSHKAGDETEKLTSNISVSAEGLVYLSSDLESMFDSLIKGLVTEGYSISSKTKEIKAEPLGNTTNSVLSPTEADVQVTLKAYEVPNIDKDKLKQELAGKSFAEAQKVLGSVRNVKDYALNINPSIPFFGFVPKDTNRINIEIKIEK
jgi:hypothetical protein